MEGGMPARSIGGLCALGDLCAKSVSLRPLRETVWGTPRPLFAEGEQE
jgi:hypothetical protein